MPGKANVILLIPVDAISRVLFLIVLMEYVSHAHRIVNVSETFLGKNVIFNYLLFFKVKTIKGILTKENVLNVL
jgi:hypothetical protein